MSLRFPSTHDAVTFPLCTYSMGASEYWQGWQHQTPGSLLHDKRRPTEQWKKHTLWGVTYLHVPPDASVNNSNPDAC